MEEIVQMLVVEFERYKGLLLYWGVWLMIGLLFVYAILAVWCRCTLHAKALLGIGKHGRIKRFKR